MPFIQSPSKLLLEYLIKRGMVAGKRERRVFEAGILAMGLEIVTVLKTLEGIPITSEAARAETESVLHTLLVEMGIADHVYELYGNLDEWRKPKFRAAVPAHAPAANADAAAVAESLRLGQTSEPSSLPEAHAETEVPQDEPREPDEEHRSSDPGA